MNKIALAPTINFKDGLTSVLDHSSLMVGFFVGLPAIDIVPICGIFRQCLCHLRKLHPFICFLSNLIIFLLLFVALGFF